MDTETSWDYWEDHLAVAAVEPGDEQTTVSDDSSRVERRNTEDFYSPGIPTPPSVAL